MTEHKNNLAANWHRQLEVNFVRDKLHWLLENSSVISPTLGQAESQLVLRPRSQGTWVRVEEINHQIVLKQDSLEPVALTAPKYVVTDLSFNLTDQQQLIINLNIDGQSYTLHEQAAASP
jgi:hypothetical protein